MPTEERTVAGRTTGRRYEAHGRCGCSSPGCGDGEASPEGLAFYREALLALRASEVSYLVGGAYALERYTGIARYTKDIDLFLRTRDMAPAVDVLERIGCRIEKTHPHWLAKAFRADEFIDIIYNSGNGISEVDDSWFDNAVDGEVLGLPVRLCPAEEMIWSKAYLMERERYDGADVAHLLYARAEALSWGRLLELFGGHWRVLLSHLVLFGFVYPSERSRIPSDVMGELMTRLQAELLDLDAADRVCRGTLVSRAQYLTDVGRWGFRDARLDPPVKMTAEDIADWTRAIGDHGGAGGGDGEHA